MSQLRHGYEYGPCSQPHACIAQERRPKEAMKKKPKDCFRYQTTHTVIHWATCNTLGNKHLNDLFDSNLSNSSHEDAGQCEDFAVAETLGQHVKEGSELDIHVVLAIRL